MSRMLRATAVDPVCGRLVSIARAAATVEYDRCVYHFCSEACGRAFTHDPGPDTGPEPCRDSEEEPKPAA